MSVERLSTSTASTMVHADLMSAERFCSQRVASSAEYQLLYKRNYIIGVESFKDKHAL